jgi:hypothetical protein
MESLRARQAKVTGVAAPTGARTLADGAKPAVSSARHTNERVVVPKGTP